MKNSGFMEQKHGSRDYPFEKYNISSDVLRVFATNHWHEEIEIIYIESGKISIKIDGAEHEGCQGDIFIINGGELHEISGKKSPLKYSAFVFDAGMLEFKNSDGVQRKYIQPVTDGKIRFLNKIEDAKGCLELLKRVDRLNRDKPECFELFTKAVLLDFFAQIISAERYVLTDDDKTNEKSELLKEIILFVEENYMQEIPLEIVAKQFNMSPKYFCRFFKNNFHKTFVEYLNDVRIEKAMNLLEDGCGVTETALQCGFNNMSYFTLIFKRKTGCTPTQYKREKLLP